MKRSCWRAPTPTTQARTHLAIARRAALEGRLVAADTHIVSAASLLELRAGADTSDEPASGGARRDPRAAAAALWDIAQAHDRDGVSRHQPQRVFAGRAQDVSAIVAGIDRVAAEQEWVITQLPHRILGSHQAAGADPGRRTCWRSPRSSITPARSSPAMTRQRPRAICTRRRLPSRTSPTAPRHGRCATPRAGWNATVRSSATRRSTSRFSPRRATRSSAS